MPNEPTVDGVTPPPAAASGGAATASDNRGAVRRLKSVLLFIIGVPYLAYIGWSVFLLVVLPDPTGEFDLLIPLAKLVAVVSAGFLLFFGVLVFLLAARAKDLPAAQRTVGIVRGCIAVLPGLLLSAIVPFLIAQEPRLALEITKPVKQEEFIAPLAVSFSVEEAVTILEHRGLKAIEYSWDFDGDSEMNENSVVPTATALYDRQGVYTVVAVIRLSDTSTRTISRRLTIPYAVFSYSPSRPIVDEPITFSVKHLVPDPKQLREIRWDFTGDGEPEESGLGAEVEYTFRRVGVHPVTVVILFVNQTQLTFQRDIEVFEPPPLPFPVTIRSESEHLISPPPFGTIFEVVTEVPLREVLWNFGDGSEPVRGMRVGHTFRQKGTFVVEAEARAVSGEIAKVRTKVRIVDQLRIIDLTFDGSPAVTNNRIIGEVPISVDLMPKTSLPLIDFYWEAPEATQIEQTSPERIRATYRKVGTYTLTLIGQDPEGQAMRLPITIEVKPVSAVISIRMVPEGGVAPLEVRFDASETEIPGKDISGFEWVFGETESSPRQAGAQVTHTFSTPGTYTISLNVFTTTGEQFGDSKTIVVRPASLSACFTASRTSGSLGDRGVVGVRFENCSTGNPSSVLWDFGDGSQGDDKSPVVIHTYDKPGKFTVTLIVKGQGGTQDISETLSITITP